MKRFLLPDILKGLAAFFMVQIHITELFIDPAGKESLAGKASLFLGGPFAAVVFMVVMGYFIAHNKHNISENVFRGIRIFILGFLLNIGLNLHLLLKIFNSGWPHNPFEYLFGIDILYLAGLSIIILAFLKLFGKWQAWAAMALFMVVGSITGTLNEKLTLENHYFVLPFIAGRYSWSYFPLFPWLVYPLAGFVFAHSETQVTSFILKNKIATRTLTISIAALVLIFSRWGVNTTIMLPSYYHHTLTYIFWALGLSLLWVLLIRQAIKQFPHTQTANFFCRIGKNITAFYVIQWLIIGNLATALYQTQTIGTFPIWTGIVFTATVLLTFAYEKAAKWYSRKA